MLSHLKLQADKSSAYLHKKVIDVSMLKKQTAEYFTLADVP